MMDKIRRTLDKCNIGMLLKGFCEGKWVNMTGARGGAGWGACSGNGPGVGVHVQCGC